METVKKIDQDMSFEILCLSRINVSFIRLFPVFSDFGFLNQLIKTTFNYPSRKVDMQ